MKRTVMIMGLAVTLTALVAFAVAQEGGMGSGGMGSDSMGSDSMGMASMPMDTSAVHVAQSDAYGAYLVDGQGRTLYTVVNMDAVVPCEGDCAEAWPPFTVESMGMMGASDMGESMGEGMGGDMDASMMLPVDADLIGTVARDDGSTQFTYDGHPLYYFVGDVDPGVISCQAVTQFGGTWYVVSPTGDTITTAGN